MNSTFENVAFNGIVNIKQLGPGLWDLDYFAKIGRGRKEKKEEELKIDKEKK